MNKWAVAALAFAGFAGAAGLALAVRVNLCEPQWPSSAFPLKPMALDVELAPGVLGAGRVWLSSGADLFAPPEADDTRVLIGIDPNHDASELHPLVTIEAHWCEIKSARVLVAVPSDPDALRTTIAHAFGDILGVPHELESWSVMHNPPPAQGALSRKTLQWLEIE